MPKDLQLGSILCFSGDRLMRWRLDFIAVGQTQAIYHDRAAGHLTAILSSKSRSQPDRIWRKRNSIQLVKCSPRRTTTNNRLSIALRRTLTKTGKMRPGLIEGQEGPGSASAGSPTTHDRWPMANYHLGDFSYRLQSISLK